MAVAQRQNDMMAIGEAFGIQIAMTILIAQAAELAIKYAFEQEIPKKVAPRTHDLYELYRSLSMERRRIIENHYLLRIKRLSAPPPADRQIVESLFLEEADALNWRYVAEHKESGVMITTFPVPFMEAAFSVLSTINWPQQETQPPSNMTGDGAASALSTPLYRTHPVVERVPTLGPLTRHSLWRTGCAEYLVDDGWKAVEVEPTVVEAHRNGTNGIGPSVELVLGNGNGRHDDADGPQQSLFSWAEFLAESR